MYWRLTATTYWEHPLDAGWGLLLVAAEVYSTIVLLLGYIQTAWPLKRTPMPLPASRDQWPTVDVFIPTYNEPLSVVKPTIYAALAIDYPADKISIHVLDDGRRHEFKAFCEEIGVNWTIRTHNRHAKAGNINEALKITNGEFLAIFDCDHIPTRSFLQIGLGWFLRDKLLSMLQTPHHFFSADPFERNLGTFRKVPNEGELFYGLVQDGNDLWNATFFCGSCAVLRRTDGRGDRRHRGRDRDRRRAHGAQAAPARLHHRVSGDSAGRGPGDRKPLRPHRPADSLGARHDADFPDRQPADRHAA